MEISCQTYSGDCWRSGDCWISSYPVLPGTTQYPVLPVRRPQTIVDWARGHAISLRISRTFEDIREVRVVPCCSRIFCAP
eukprot:1334681-Amorphochlora_amoeboformis.AAC.1